MGRNPGSVPLALHCFLLASFLTQHLSAGYLLQNSAEDHIGRGVPSDGQWRGRFAGQSAEVLPAADTRDIPASLSTSPLPWACDFEDGNFCTWTQGSNNDFDWIIQTGTTPTVGTGPPADHTTQTKEGHYAVIDASSAQVSERAYLYIDEIPASNDICLVFWYHMYGAHVGELGVGFGHSTDPEEGESIWVKSGDQGYNWLYGHVQFSTELTDIKLYFEGIAGAGNQGDIAIDDVMVLNGSCPALLFCDFQADDLCGYYNEVTNDLDWDRVRGVTAGTSPPYIDHSTGTTNGFYMRVKTGQLTGVGDRATLWTPPYPTPFSGYRCLHIWYVISDDVGEFTVTAYPVDDGGAPQPPTASITFTDITGSFWRKASLEVDGTTDDYGHVFAFVFKALERGPGAVVALDDVFAMDGRCIGEQGSCDFEINTCDWANTQNADEADWLRHSGSTGNGNTGPQFDHTTGTPSGWYLYMDSALSGFGKRARLESSSIALDADDDGGSMCFGLWYHMLCSGTSSNTLTVMWESNLQTVVIWLHHGRTDDEWTFKQIDFLVSSQYRLIVEGTLGSDSACDIAIDDLYLSTDACVDTTQAPPFVCETSAQPIAGTKQCDMHLDCTDGSDEVNCGSCSFLQDTCGYQSDTAGLFPWIQHGGGASPTPPPGLVLPIRDEVGLNGTYMIVDNTVDSFLGADYARLVGPEIRGVGDACMMLFWFYLSGADELTVSQTTSPAEETIMYRSATPRVASWQQGLFSVGRIRNPFQINFLGRPDSTVERGVIAVSDISLVNCGFPEPRETCLVGEFSCSNRACVPIDVLCDYADDCGDYSDELMCDPDRYTARCNFESDLCSFAPITGDYAWLRIAGALVPDKAYAPTRDHTTNGVGGHYMLADALGRSPGEVARFVSPTFQETGLASLCWVRFYFFAHGPDAGKLNVYTRTTDGGSLVFVETITNLAIDSFTMVDVNLISLKIFQVVFEAEVGPGPEAAIAIDDISFVNCDLSSESLPVGTTQPPPTTLPPCPSSTDFRCGDGACVSEARVCDFAEQCANGADEMDCGQCEFDDGFCGSTNFGWRRRQAGSDPDYLPTDRFNSTEDTGYYLESSYGVNTLNTPLIGPTGPGCQVELYYYMSNASALLELRVYVWDGPQLAIIRGVNGAPARWEREVVDVGKFTFKIQLAFDHLNFLPSDMFMALDGISYINCMDPSAISTQPPVVTTVSSPETTAQPQTESPPTTAAPPPTATSRTTSHTEPTEETSTLEHETASPPNNNALIISMSVIFGVLFVVLVVSALIYWQKRRSNKMDLTQLEEESSDYEKGAISHYAMSGM